MQCRKENNFKVNFTVIEWESIVEIMWPGYRIVKDL
jgi:hypothetical protein